MKVTGGSLPSPSLLGDNNFDINNQRKPRNYYATLSSLSAAASADATDNQDGDSSALSPIFFSSHQKNRILVARVTVLLGIFWGGYRLGRRLSSGGGALSAAPQLLQRRRQPLIVWFAGAVLIRDAWRQIPAWAKPRLLQRAAADTALLLGVSPPSSPQASDEAAATTTTVDDSDISNFDTLFGKLGAVLKVMNTKLPTNSTSTSFDSFWALLQLTQQFKDQRSPIRGQLYQNDPNSRVASRQELQHLGQLMEYADWAYDEDASGKSLKELLNEEGWSLLKHDTTAVPGYLGHYVAIPARSIVDKDDDLKEGNNNNNNEDDTTPSMMPLVKNSNQKIALIGVKGTSGLEDLITDMCGASVSLSLDRPYYWVVGNDNNSNNSANNSTHHSTESSSTTTTATTLRAHEGILIAARRLANDLQPFVQNLLLPQGYKIVLVGHSLGAAAAALVGILLRSQIPELQLEYCAQDGSSNNSNNERLQVYAFASPPTLDLKNAKIASLFVTSIVNNGDIITRCNVAPLLATVQVLNAVDEKLKSRRATQKTSRRSRQNWTKVWEQPWLARRITKGESIVRTKAPSSSPLFQEAEFMNVIEKATAATSDDDEEDDEDHLYVPGKVVLMYNDWADKRDDDDDDDDLKQVTANEPAIPKGSESVANRAVVCDGTAKALRFIEFNSRMVEDHMAKDYKASLRRVTALATISAAS